MNALTELQAIAVEALAALDTGRQIPPFSSRTSSFNLDDAYRVTAAVRKMREARGEMPVGRKIGFTNRTVWADYNVNEPIWGYVYDRTVHYLAEIGDTFSLMHLAEPRIEPEIVFRLAVAPAPGMDERTLLAERRLGCARFRSRTIDLSLDGSFPFPTRSQRLACTVPCLSGLVTRSQRMPRIGAGRFRLSKSI